MQIYQPMRKQARIDHRLGSSDTDRALQVSGLSHLLTDCVMRTLKLLYHQRQELVQDLWDESKRLQLLRG